MGIKVNVGLAKKIGQPDYGSLGATCNVEFELDGGFDNGSTQHFQDAVKRAYLACRQSVEAEIAGSQPTINPVGGQQATTQVNRVAHQSTNGGDVISRRATSSQVRAIHAIANRNGVDLTAVLGSQYRVVRPDDLSIRDASTLIDQLKEGANGSGNAVSR